MKNYYSLETKGSKTDIYIRRYYLLRILRKRCVQLHPVEGTAGAGYG